MQSKEEIKELLEKFLSGEIGEKEEHILFELFRDAENKKYIFNWIKEYWNILDDSDLKIEIASEDLLHRIHAQIHKNSTPVVQKQTSSKINKIVRIGLRYAAVVLLACLVEWYLLAHKAGNQQPFVQLQYNEIAVPHGSKSFIVLADSTKVWLNAGAKLRYPTNFDKKSREVFLEGEAFFDVHKNKNLPFLVRMSGMSIKVHGTKFNVKSYNEDARIETTLLEGSIEVLGLKSDKDNSKNLFLKPGQKLILFKDRRGSKISPFKIENDTALLDQPVIQKHVKIKNAELINLSNSEPEIAWKKDKMVFERQRFEEVRTRLERWYGVTIDVQDTSILNYRFTGTFDKETFEQAMQALKKAARFEYALKKKHVIIKKEM